MVKSLCIALMWYIVFNENFFTCNFSNPYAVSCPSGYSRYKWGASDPKVERPRLELKSVPYVVVHHSNTQPCDSVEECLKLVKSIQQKHMGQEGMTDIAYNFLIGGPYGKLYEGLEYTAYGARSAVRGGKHIDICLLGNYSGTSPSHQQLVQLSDFITIGIACEALSQSVKLIAHSQIDGTTTCPGHAFVKALAKNRYFDSTYDNSDNSCTRGLTRSEWKARNPKSIAERLDVNPAPFFVVHHSETRSCINTEDCAKLVKSIQNEHMDKNGWDDIGYNFLMGHNGEIFKGRGYNAIGAHAPVYNRKSIGLCVLGNYTLSPPNEAQMKSLKDFITNGIACGAISPSVKVVGHLQVRATDCPGAAFQEALTAIPHFDPTYKDIIKNKSKKH